MRYLTIPDNADTSGVLSTRAGYVDSWPFIDGFLVALVLPRMPRDNAVATSLLVSIIDKLSSCVPGSVVELTDAEHEALVKALPNGRDEIAGELLIKVARFFHAVTSASAEKPAGAKKEARDAVQESEAASVSAREAPGHRKAMGKGNSKSKEASQESEA